MDSDRKSTVSSFYGGRRSSVDALNRDYVAPPPMSDPRARRDSSSSFFNPTATGTLPRGAAGPTRTNGAGYNRMSYFDAGREEPVKGGYDEVEQPNEGGWDVYADFNNAGPRYSNAFGLGNNDTRCVAFHHSPGSARHVRGSYQQLSPQLTGKMDEEANSQGPVELVTVPALGAEWGKDELKDMTKRGRKEKKSEERGRKWKAFNRGEYGMFGSKWLTRRTLVFSLFALCTVCVVTSAPFFCKKWLTRSFQHRCGARLHYPARAGLQHQWADPSCDGFRLLQPVYPGRIQPFPRQLFLPGCFITSGRHRLELPTARFQTPRCAGVRPRFISSRRNGSLQPHQGPSKDLLIHTDAHQLHLCGD